MYQIFTRIRLILAVLAGVSIFAIDNDLFLFSIGAFVLIYFVFLSDSFFEVSLKNLEKTLGEIDTGNAIKQPKFSQEKIIAKKIDEESEEELSFSKKRQFSSPIEEFAPLEELTFPTKDIAIHEQQEYISQPREPSIIEKFFSENLLAKLGGILVFLGVLFLLSLIYSVIGPVAKMCIGLAIGFACYGAGVFLDKKGFINESRIVMGTAILINYLVILSGRHLLGDDSSSDSTLLSIGMTFVFLILNTIFAVVSALVYNSRPLLLFAFVFAYANPLLLGAAGTEPYTLLGYTMIVTLGAMYMAYAKKDEILFPLSFVLAAIMFLIAPWTDGAGWVAKLLCINMLGTLSLYVSSVFEKKYQNLGEILIAGTFFLIGVMGFLGIANLSPLQLIIMGGSSLGLMLLSYFNMNKGVYLYSIGTLGTVLTLTPALLTNGLREDTLFISACIIGAFALCNIGVIITKSKEILAGNLGNIISGLVSGALFLSFMIYNFGNTYFPGIAQGFGFFFLAIIYISLAFLIVQKIGIDEIRSDEKYQNIFYTISALGVSLFSLAVAFVFAKNPEIISIIWILEASVLFFLTQKTGSQKIALGGIILFFIGTVQLFELIFSNLSGNYGMLVSVLIVLLSLIANLYLFYSKGENTNKISSEFYVIHDLIHIFAMGFLVVLSYQILNISNSWNSLLYVSGVVSTLGILYQTLGSQGLKKAYFLLYSLALFSHIALFLDHMGRGSLNLGISTFVLCLYALPLIYDYIKNETLTQRGLLTVFVLYFFILSSSYVYHVFDVTFAITLYWGILSFVLLGYGISKDILYLRTIGLYMITLTAGKVFLYDIWMSVDDTVSRVVALIVVGILMIVLSTMYTRKYGNNLNAEFSPENLFPKNTPDLPHQETVVTHEQKEKSSLMQDIEQVDVSEYSAVVMKIHGSSKTFTIKAQNLIKIAKIIETNLGKKTFIAGELSDIQENVLAEYQTELPESQFKKLKEVVAAFVEHGGEIEFTRKK